MNKEPNDIWKRLVRKCLVVAIPTFLIIFLFLILKFKGFNDSNSFIIAILFAAIIAVIFSATVYWFLLPLFSWRNFKRLLFGLACFITLIALFYAEENWRGKHDWEKYKRAEEAKGEKFDWQSVIPPKVPDDENFAFSPVWVADIRYGFWGTGKSTNWYGDKVFSEEVSNLAAFFPISATRSNDWNSAPGIGNWAKFSMTDLQAWQNYYCHPTKTNSAKEFPIAPQPQTPAQDVLLALSKFDPVIDELKKDSARPYAYFPIQYETEPPFEILLPHLTAVKQIALVLQLRALAELQNNQTDAALGDIKLSLRLMDSVRCEPFIISQLVRIAILQIMLQPIYEGLAEHKWSDNQLAELDSELSKLNFLGDYESSVRGERTMAVSAIDYMRRTREIETPDFSTRGAKVQIARFIPSAFFYQNELTIAQMHQRWTIPLVNDQAQTVSPLQVEREGAAAKNELNHFHFYGIFARMIFPAIANAVKKYTYAQESVDLARVAIALERFRIAHGNFPDSLDALAPQFLEKIPHDIIGGPPSQSSGATSQPLHYRKTSDQPSQSSGSASGNFILYSAGWNETDDGGVVVFKKGSTPDVDIDKGDWVWRYPQK